MKDITLQAHLHNGNIAQSYLLIDCDIIKLKNIAKWFAGNYSAADIFYLEGTPNIKVEETENFISKANLASIGDKKLFVLCDASTMTPAAQNKILKTIEDTPPNTTFMLLASSATPILNTIKSRCIIIYPDPITPSMTETAVCENNPNTKQIFIAAEKLLTQCKTLDDALPHLPLLTKKENLPITLIAINNLLSTFLQEALINKANNTKNTLTLQKTNAILKCLSIIKRNIAAGCNPQNAFDILLIELFK